MYEIKIDSNSKIRISLKKLNGHKLENMSVAKPILTLKQFMLRQEVLKLYRRIIRTIKEVPDKQHQKELKDWARNDFRINAHHKDEITIKMLINYGDRSLRELQTSLSLAK